MNLIFDKSLLFELIYEKYGNKANFSRATGISKAELTKIEKGHGNMSASTIYAMQEALQLDLKTFQRAFFTPIFL